MYHFTDYSLGCTDNDLCVRAQLDKISDRAWAALAPHLVGKAGDVGRAGTDNRLFPNAVFWATRHGCAWWALPARFGKHDTLRKRSRRWAQKEI